MTKPVLEDISPRVQPNRAPPKHLHDLIFSTLPQSHECVTEYHIVIVVKGLVHELYMNYTSLSARHCNPDVLHIVWASGAPPLIDL